MKRHAGAILALSLAAAAIAARTAAAQPIEVTIGTGIGGVSGSVPIGTVNTTVSARAFPTHVSVGYHYRDYTFGLRVETFGDLDAQSVMYLQNVITDDYSMVPLDVAFEARSQEGKLWTTAWLGAAFIRRRATRDIDATIASSRVDWLGDGAAIGLQAGYDVWSSGTNRIAVAGEVRTGLADPSTVFVYTTTSVGLLYRFGGG